MDQKGPKLTKNGQKVDKKWTKKYQKWSKNGPIMNCMTDKLNQNKFYHLRHLAANFQTMNVFG